MKKFISAFIIICFLITGQIGPLPLVCASAHALEGTGNIAQDFRLPSPGQMVALSFAYNPVVLKGIKLDPKDPFRFHFFVDSGDSKLSQEELKSESSKLIKYFLTSLTIPGKDLWVNLSPYEKDRIVPQEFGQTEMGRDLLAEDYLLKQITASLIYPENQLGKEFWAKVYAQAQAKYGTTNISINTFNKVWIVPEQAVVYENRGVVFVLENHLKVMLEQDYLSLQKHEGIQTKQAQAKDTNQFVRANPATSELSEKSTCSLLAKNILQAIVIPALTEEVNEGKNFSQLRQVFYSLILATWYKKKIKDSMFNKVYSNQNKIGGVNVSAGDKDKIYQEYLKAFKKGVYNYIKEEADPFSNEATPRKYFSGGVMAQYRINVNLAMVGPKQVSLKDFASLGRIIEIDGSTKLNIKPVDLLDKAMKSDLGETSLIRPMTSGDFRGTILRVLNRIRKIGDLKKLWSMSFPELMDAVGGHEIKDPRYSSLTMNFAFYVSPECYKQIEFDRDAFRKKHGIIGPLTLEDLYKQAPRAGYYAPETAGPYDHLADIHPEITGSGIYYHRHASTRVERIDDLKISILFHEMLEEAFHTYKLRDEIFDQWFHHAHPLLVVAEVYLSAFLGPKTLSLSIATHRRQIRDIENTRHFKLPATSFMDTGSKEMIGLDRLSQYIRAIAEAYAELEDPLNLGIKPRTCR